MYFKKYKIQDNTNKINNQLNAIVMLCTLVRSQWSHFHVNILIQMNLRPSHRSLFLLLFA